MDPGDVRRFLDRDWARVERAKLDHWIDTTRALGVAPAIRAADMLRRHAARFSQEDPEEQRAEDLEAHIALKRRIDAASRRLGR